MKLTIDTTAKTVELEDFEANLKDLLEVLKGLIGKEWKDYKIRSKQPTYWYYPTYPTYPTYSNSTGTRLDITGGNLNSTYSLQTPNNAEA